jgi:beta-glucanase (GH16 family)
MKRSLSACLLLINLFITVPANSQSFKLVWSDEFNGEGAPDPAKWDYELGYIRNDELQYYTKNTSNARQHNGNLEITVRKEKIKGSKEGKATTFEYSSGSVITLNKADWTYGKIEGRFKIPQGKGLWSCFWTLGASINEEGWPKCGEIDIFEHINSEILVHGTAHWANDLTRHVSKGADSPEFDVTQWHTYSIVWTPGYIKWYIDDVQFHEVSILDGINSTQEFHKPHYVLINLPIGGSWPGSPDITTVLPATLYCDYIRIYEMENNNNYSQTYKLSDTALRSGNPILKGWYADPEGIIFGNQYWIYPTYSDDYGQPDRSTELTEQQLQAQKKTINKQYIKQAFFDAFSSEDLIKWEKHSHVLDIKDVKWAAYSLWAPSIIKANNKYFLFFSANDIQNDQEYGGIGVAVSDNAGGPFKDYLGKPLINKFANGAQPIDQFIFRDQDGKYYLIYGGWRHCNIVQIKDDFTGLIPYPDGSVFKEITPENYVEGPFMFIRKGKYYLMWSEGNWTGPDYSVSYAMADSPFGPFKRVAKVLQQDEKIARGAGHHSVINIPNTDDWYIVYHRRPLNETDGNHRETCIDRMYFDENGLIEPVKMTFEGVKQYRIKN